MALLTDRVAVITGASKGIGRAMCQLFAHEGAKVVCAARSDALVKETAALIVQAGGQAIAVTADAGREDDARRLIDEAIAAFGRVDTLVNNAGDSGPTKAVQDTSVEEWLYTINSSLTSAYLCTRLPRRHRSRAGAARS